MAKNLDFDDLIRKRQKLKNQQDNLEHNKRLTSGEINTRRYELEIKIRKLDTDIKDNDPYYKKSLGASKTKESDFPDWRDDRIQPGDAAEHRRQKMVKSKKTAREKREEYNAWLDRRNKTMSQIPAHERDAWADDYEKRNPKPLGSAVVPDERRHPFLNTVVLGAAAALGGAIVSIAFNVLASRKNDQHRLVIPQNTLALLPTEIQNACLYPSVCSLSVWTEPS